MAGAPPSIGSLLRPARLFALTPKMICSPLQSLAEQRPPGSWLSGPLGTPSTLGRSGSSTSEPRDPHKLYCLGLRNRYLKTLSFLLDRKGSFSGPTKNSLIYSRSPGWEAGWRPLAGLAPCPSPAGKADTGPGAPTLQAFRGERSARPRPRRRAHWLLRLLPALPLAPPAPSPAPASGALCCLGGGEAGRRHL